MGKNFLDSLNQAGNTLLAYSQHPVRSMEREFQSAYLNGLAGVMVADEKVSEEEKENIKRLLISFDMPEEKLEDLIAFGENPDGDALREILMVLQGAEDLRFVFLLDCLSLANADNELHEDETNIITTYSDFIKVSSSQLELIEHLEQIVRSKDHKALYRFFLQKYDLDLTVFKYLLDFYKVDIEQVKQEERKRLTKLFGFKFVAVGQREERLFGSHTHYPHEYSFEHRAVEGGIKKPTSRNSRTGLADFAGLGEYKLEGKEKDKYAFVSESPLQLLQLNVILQDQLEQQIIRVENEWVIENESDRKLLSLENSLLMFDHGQFSFETNTHATGLTRYGLRLASEWINTLTNLNLSPISMKTGFSENDQIESSQFAFELKEYVEVHNDSYSADIKPSYDEGNKFEVKKIKKWKAEHTDTTTVFRLMRTQKK